MPRIRVLNVITDTNFGGAGRLLVNYLKNFDREKFDISVAIPENSLLTPEIKKLGYRVIETKFGADKSFEKEAVRELMGIIKVEKPDIVHAHASLSARFAAYFCGIKSRIYTRHCYYDLSKRDTSFPKKQITGFINNVLSTEIIAVADAAKQNLLDTGVSEKKITVIVNGVEQMRVADKSEISALRASMGVSDEDFFVAISARLEPVKGHDTFLKAAKIVCEKCGDAKFMIMGTGSLENTLKETAKEYGISDRVIFTGLLSDVSGHVNAMDLNVNCSYGTETSSLALSEAMSVGKPALATDFGGNPYMVTDGVNGYLYPTHDADRLAELILKIKDDKALYNRLSEGALKCYREKFTAKKMTEKLEEVYISEYERRCRKK